MKVERPLAHDAFENALDSLLTAEPSSLYADFSGSTGSAQDFLQDGMPEFAAGRHVRESMKRDTELEDKHPSPLLSESFVCVDEL